MTRRRSSYRSLASLQRDNRVCRACAEAGYPLESLPVLRGPTGPEARTSSGRRPGSSRVRSAGHGAGGRARRCAAGLSWRRTRSTRRSTARRSLAAIPGGAPGWRRRPNAGRARAGALRVLARLGARLLRPRLIVPVGGLAIRGLLGVDEPRRVRSASDSRYGDAVAVPLPHPSGVSRWLERSRRIRRCSSERSSSSTRELARSAALNEV